MVGAAGGVCGCAAAGGVATGGWAGVVLDVLSFLLKTPIGLLAAAFVSVAGGGVVGDAGGVVRGFSFGGGAVGATGGGVLAAGVVGGASSSIGLLRAWSSTKAIMLCSTLVAPALRPFSTPADMASISGGVSMATSARSAVQLLLTMRSRRRVILLACLMRSSSGGGRDR